ncbi:type II toxin-antitoxin system HicA family toxin [Sphingomonas bacterium]|uniref:type II toxin-antitoxin system HicA family toxin n=1 Tax=Sphingomonas bacterium TaxID=1895847 RepID=UPI0020C702DE|nr:type II toxin-antitoxin system HicA family toxin [Sphingomonas bacterium]
MADDLLARMRANPRDWRMADVEQLCRNHGALCTPPRKGSHYKVKHPLVNEILVVPAHRPIKPVYIRALVRFIDAVREASA